MGGKAERRTRSLFLTQSFSTFPFSPLPLLIRFTIIPILPNNVGSGSTTIKEMYNSTFLFNFLGPEMIVIFFAILLLFGGKKIPELMKGIGKGIREFNTAKGTLEKELQAGMKDEEQREKDARELRELREREAQREREESFITRDEKSA
jgi:sec-independent protein translocase protein TatA